MFHNTKLQVFELGVFMVAAGFFEYGVLDFAVRFKG
ncbi:hypothetical protein Pint_02016 [Pistacia integerrima]|uniref:Uncharacterized protein n=1 Tax=Pistacia integerrima TaxID=434235 RepID=A0ACC0ZPP3_9ROSI|nr:hypothetical protein Pint_02016 [Pistacia integerrima]